MRADEAVLDGGCSVLWSKPARTTLSLLGGRIQNRFQTLQGAGHRVAIASSHIVPVAELDPYCIDASEVSFFPMAGKQCT